jgi:hypothetical protein
MILPTTATRSSVFRTKDGAGMLVDADSPPTVALLVNGESDPTATVVTVNPLEVFLGTLRGTYQYTYDLAAFSPGDHILELISAVVDGSEIYEEREIQIGDVTGI